MNNFRNMSINIKLATPVVLALSLTACQHNSTTHTHSHAHKPADTPHVKPTNQKNLKHRWRLIRFMNYSPTALQEASLDLTAFPRANLYAGCNQIMFEVNTAGNHFLIEETMSTRMACINNTLENDLSQALKRVTTYQLEGNLLSLRTSNRQTIILSR